MNKLLNALAMICLLLPGQMSAAWAADIFISTTATGDDDGTSWANAYPTWADADTGESGFSDGDRIYTNAPESAPFAEHMEIDGLNNVIIDTGVGPDGVTFIVGMDTLSGWTDVGGGIYSKVTADVAYVSYDFKRDTIDGALTGVDLTTPRYAQGVARSTFNAADLVAWYGFLDDAGATATPAEGEFGYTGGTLYINVPGSPSVADVAAKTRVLQVARNGIEMSGGDNCHIRGRFFGLLFPSSTFGGSPANVGYVGKINNGTNCSIRGGVAVHSGYHSFGAAGSSGGVNNNIYDCASIGCNAEVDFVFFSDTASVANGPFLGQDLVIIPNPRFGIDGTPLDSDAGGYVYSHSDTPNTLGGVTWDRVTLLDFAPLIEAKHSVTFTRRWLYPADAGNLPSYDRTIASDRPIKMTDSYMVGRYVPWTRVGYERCLIDPREARASASYGAVYSLTVAGGNYDITLRGCVFYLPNAQIVYDLIQTGDRLELEGNTFIYTHDTQENRLFGFSGVSATGDTLVSLKSNVFAATADAANRARIAVGDATTWNNSFPRLVSDGNNVFDTTIVDLLDHGNNSVTERQLSWWTANVSGGSTDAQASPGYDDITAGIVSIKAGGHIDSNRITTALDAGYTDAFGRRFSGARGGIQDGQLRLPRGFTSEAVRRALFGSPQQLMQEFLANE